jgi:glucokinase
MSIDWVCGIETGGTNVTVVLGNTEAGFLKDTKVKERVDFSSGDGKFVEQILKMREKATKKAGIRVGQIRYYGIAAAGQPNKDGTISQAANCPFDQTFPRAVSDNQRDRFRIINDVGGAAYASMLKGYGLRFPQHDSRTKLYVASVLGTGHNTQMLINGELVTGLGDMSYETGHYAFGSRQTGRVCGCELRGCAEAYISGRAIGNIAREILITKGEIEDQAIISAAKERLKAGKMDMAAVIGRIEAEDVFTAYEKGRDNLAKHILLEARDNLARHMGNMLNVLPMPPYVEWYGGIVENHRWFFDGAVKKLHKTPDYWGNRNLTKSHTQILLTKVENLGLQGTVYMAIHELRRKG